MTMHTLSLYLEYDMDEGIDEAIFLSEFDFLQEQGAGVFLLGKPRRDIEFWIDGKTNTDQLIKLINTLQDIKLHHTSFSWSLEKD